MSNIREPVLFTRLDAAYRKYRIETFCETGTGPDPGGVGIAQALWLNTYSCDTSASSVKRASERYPQAHIQQRESTAFLRSVLPSIARQRTFFWLDAHFGHFDEYDAPKNLPLWPVLDEMRIIREQKVGIERDVIWIDDIFCICDPENPRYREPEMHASQLAQRDHAFAEYACMFQETHYATVYTDFEGVLAFYPRALP